LVWGKIAFERAVIYPQKALAASLFRTSGKEVAHIIFLRQTLKVCPLPEHN
jgi:hypothetical protein